MKNTRLSILGVMTGTSCDGLDAACIQIDTKGWTPIWTASSPYPMTLRKKVLAFQEPNARHSIRELLELHRDLGDWYGLIIKKMMKKQKGRLDLIANHGQTVAHFPEEHSKGMTLQLGDSSRIATLTGITVASNFREGDLAAGGQGAPLVPLFHRLLATGLPGAKKGLAIHNIGGVSNLSYVGPAGELFGFDTGPGNIWIDAAMEKATRGKQKIDRGGKVAAKGKIDWKSLELVLKHPYFAKPLPKSTGRDDFPNSYFYKSTSVKGASLVATATAITVESIARAYEKYILRKGLPLDTILISGGGAKNYTLLQQLKARLPGVKISTLAAHGLDPQYIEAQAFAVFGFMSLVGFPLGGKWTGAKTYGPPGHLVPGKNWRSVLAKLTYITQ